MEENKRTIVTYYFDHRGRKMKIKEARKAVHPNSAVLRAINNMRMNVYGAWKAVVFDEETAEHFCSIRRSVKGNLSIDENKDPRDYMDPFRRKTLYALIPKDQLE